MASPNFLNDLLVEALSPILEPLSELTPTSFSYHHPTSHVPSDKVPTIHSVVTQRKSQLAALDDHISLLNHALDKLQNIQARLKEKRAIVQESLTFHEALASPTRCSLPSELLGEIFLRCLPRTNYVTPSSDECPLVLTRVCRHWRAVALSTPRLWASLSISLSRADTTSGDEYKHWLEKARSVPLSIRVVHDMDHSDGKEPLSIQWLRPFLGRCSDLWWHGPPVQGLLDNSVQSLSRFQVTFHKANFLVSIPSPMPQLRSAVLQSHTYDLRSLRSIDLPWHQLLDLKIQFALVNSATFLQVIGLCTQVQRVSVSSICVDASPQTDLQPFPLIGTVNHSIRRLEVNVIRVGLGNLFEALTLPALEELVIRFCSPDGHPWPHKQFSAFVTRSKCPLKLLTIHRNKGANSHVTEYLKMLPGLKMVV
ncbi:hypothetical protein CY34DRAFT_811315 [Suillus luteus UH-Slu-Lm8-n1]|uniref:Unplaced genomic scaffold CY34scaffold_402, whole genome shotgun sequence n=1 Tax=Suillus luteus UH-Slu-Lm8-n1 TaxID=930992 RepID=A0A0C9ZG31_9AGAM|nr:hypothetical protein CY34DRAFT_811315 [Suillus luteus UH-Slu-Lm8-n1]